MDSINVTGSSELIVALSKVEIPETRRLSLIVTTASTSESQRATMLALNRTLRKAVVRAEASLTILDDAIAVDAQAIDWPSLTHVQIAATTQVGTALAIIGRLSGIVHAAFYNILVEGVPDEACLLNGPAAKHTRVAPLNASLQQLALGHEQSAGADEATAATIKYLALALPRLRMLCAWAPVDLRPFIDDYSSVYPHLSGIHFRLGAAE
ncbi:hypothetical protein H4R19_004156 [Coemansia spiralis]|nr:hypothetical protein H4R19_004156 [Coemansia spiralis]